MSHTHEKLFLRTLPKRFDLIPDACDGSCFHLVQNVNLPIDIHFDEAVAQTVNIVVYAEFTKTFGADLVANDYRVFDWLKALRDCKM